MSYNWENWNSWAGKRKLTEVDRAKDLRKIEKKHQNKGLKVLFFSKKNKDEIPILNTRL